MCLFVTTSFAASPWYVDPAGTGYPFVWEKGEIVWYIETGDLGPLKNTEVVKIIEEAFAAWANAALPIPGLSKVKTSAATAKFGGIIDTDINLENVSDYLAQYPDKTLIILDDDGSIIEAGDGDESMGAITLEFKPPWGYLDATKLYLRRGTVILNGASYSLQKADVANNNDGNLRMFKATVMHELGHLFGLDHSGANQLVGDITEQVKGVKQDPNLPNIWPNLYPLVAGPEQDTLNDDDIVAISTSYPRPALRDSFCAIEGQLIGADGSGLQGVQVVARSILDEKVEVITAVSGNRFPLGTADGSYSIKGIRPGRWYRVELEPLNPKFFLGGSGIQPNDPPLSGFEPGIITANGGKLDIVVCDEGGQTIPMDTIQLGISKGGTPPPQYLVAIGDPLKPKSVKGGGGGASTEKKGGCALILPSSRLTPAP